MMENSQRTFLLKQIFQFFDEISIPYNFTEIAAETFLPGIQIKNGSLQIDLKKLKYPGDLLHEAGHIAVTLSAERKDLNDNVIENDETKAGEEMAVLLWSYAALRKMDLDTEIVFHENGYKGEATWLRQQFENRNYIGLPLLQWMGLTDVEGENAFPKMKMWLRN